MALQSLPSLTNLAYPSGVALLAASFPALSATTIDASGEKIAAMVTAPKTGNITKIGFRTNTVTTAETLEARVETINTSDGFPSGTLWGTNTNGTQASPASSTWYWVTLTAAVAVTQGDQLALVIQFASTIGNLEILFWGNRPLGVELRHPGYVTNTGSWTVTNSAPLCAIEYDDGTRPFCGGFPINSSTISQTVNTGSTPDEVGAKFRVPFKCKVVGACYAFSAAAATTYAIKLYDSDGSTVLESKTGIRTNRNPTGSGGIAVFDTEVTLNINTYYRLTILPEEATNLTIYRGVVDQAATLQSWPGGQDWHWTERTDAGGWTDTTTRVPFLAVLLSALDDGAGSVIEANYQMGVI